MTESYIVAALTCAAMGLFLGHTPEQLFALAVAGGVGSCIGHLMR